MNYDFIQRHNDALFLFFCSLPRKVKYMVHFSTLASTELIFSSVSNTKTYFSGNRQHGPCNFVCEARFVFPHVHCTAFIPKELTF